MENLIIRETLGKDFNEIVKLLKQLWADKEINKDSLQKIFDAAMSDPSDRMLSAQYNKNVIGFCYIKIINNFWAEGKIAIVYILVVDEDHRGQGIGKKLMEKVFEICKNNDCIKIELDSAFHREKAHEFYKNLGFSKRAYFFSKNIM